MSKAISKDALILIGRIGPVDQFGRTRPFLNLLTGMAQEWAQEWVQGWAQPWAQ